MPALKALLLVLGASPVIFLLPFFLGIMLTFAVTPNAVAARRLIVADAIAAMLFTVFVCPRLYRRFRWYPRSAHDDPLFDEIDPVCEACGYNLIGNESGICPECGTRK